MVWLAVANILAHFNISAGKDESGAPIPLDKVYWSAGVVRYDSLSRRGYTSLIETTQNVSHPSPFECSIVPRNPS